MSKTFKLRRDYFADGWILYNKANITIESGVTVLVGCNGSGKTTFIRHVDRQLEIDEIPHLYFNNLFDGGNKSIQEALFKGNMGFVMQNAFSSEGERIRNNICELAAKCGRMVHNAANNGKKEVWLLLDAVDSGLSVDNIVDIKENLFNLMIEDAQKIGVEVYIVIVANEYEVARNENCLDIYHGSYIKFKDYDDYRTFVLKSREIKDKRFVKKQKKAKK